MHRRRTIMSAVLATAVLSMASLSTSMAAPESGVAAVHPSDMGWYQDMGDGTALHAADNPIALTGQFYDYMLRSWYLFDLSGIDPRFEVVGATFEVTWTYSTAPGTYTLHDVTTPPTTLTANHYPPTADAAPIYQDLGTGTVYGSLTIVEPDMVRLPHAAVPLNASGIAAIEAAIAGGNDGQLAMGATYPADDWVAWGPVERTALWADDPLAVALTLSLGPSDDFFLSPVDNFPFVNVLKAGGAVPVTFSLGGYHGMDIFATEPTVVPVACEAGLVTDTIESYVTAKTNSLTYDPLTDQYTFVWKTQKGWTGCRELQLTLLDGSTHVAEFMFR